MDLNLNLENLTDMGLIKNSTKSITMNEAGMDNLATETIQVAKMVNDYLNKIIDIMDSTQSFYKCENGDLLRANFNNLRVNFPFVVQNIENYAYSLKKAKNNFMSQADIAINHLSNATLNVQDLIRKEGN